MNDLDEFAEVALAMLALTLLVWLLTYLERALIRPATDKRARRGSDGGKSVPSRARPQTTSCSQAGR